MDAAQARHAGTAGWIKPHPRIRRTTTNSHHDGRTLPTMTECQCPPVTTTYDRNLLQNDIIAYLPYK